MISITRVISLTILTVFMLYLLSFFFTREEPITLNDEICAIHNRQYLDLFSAKEDFGLCTFYDLTEAIAFAQQKKAPILLQFTGHTCFSSRAWETVLFQHPKIAPILKEQYVMVSLYTDERASLHHPKVIDGKEYTKIGRSVLNYQKKQYNVFAQPYFVLMDPFKESEGAEVSNLTSPRGYDDDVDAYVKFLENGIAEFERRYN